MDLHTLISQHADKIPFMALAVNGEEHPKFSGVRIVEAVIIAIITACGSGHVHGVSDPGHAHSFSAILNVNAATHTALTSSGTGYSASSGTTNSNTTGISVSSHTTGVTASASRDGSGDAHTNTQPTMVMNWIMRVI